MGVILGIIGFRVLTKGFRTLAHLCSFLYFLGLGKGICKILVAFNPFPSS